VSPRDRDDPEQIEKDRQEAARKRGWFEPARPPRTEDAIIPALVLPPRRIHVQAGAGRPLGHVPWEEHAEACARLGKNAERVAARGGLGWDEMCAALGREPRGWREW